MTFSNGLTASSKDSNKVSILLKEAEEKANSYTRLFNRLGTRWQFVGELRRKASEVSKIEVVIIPRGGNMKRLIERLTGRATVKRVSKIEYHTNLLPQWDVPVVLYIANHENFPLLTLFKTGPIGLLNKLRKKAKDLGLSFSEEYLTRDKKTLPVVSEADIFAALGIEYLKPTERN